MPVTRNPNAILALSSLASGAALLAAILFGASLPISLCLLYTLTGMVFLLVFRHSAAVSRTRILTRMGRGLQAGLVATSAYDAVRWLIVTIGGLQFRPFESFRLFGQLLIGNAHSLPLTFTVGFLYHLVNGVSFSIGYSLLLGGRAWWWGIGWALLLEGLMLTVYPGWLDLHALMKEFTIVSVSGHLAFGTVLGLMCRQLPSCAMGGTRP